MSRYYVGVHTLKTKNQARYGLKWFVRYALNEPELNNTNKMTCAPSVDSDQPRNSYQPGHSPNLINICCALCCYHRAQIFFRQIAKTEVSLGLAHMYCYVI